MKTCSLVLIPIVLLLIHVHSLHAQFTATSVSASGNASVSGGGFPSDSEGFSVNNFTGIGGVSASAFSGLLLNSGSSSAYAETTQSGNVAFGGFQIGTRVSAVGFETFSPFAGVQTEIVFQLDTAYDVDYFSRLTVNGGDLDFPTFYSSFFVQIEANGNTVLASDSLGFGSDLRETSFTGRIGPGTYSFGSDGDASGDSFGSFGDSFQSITLTAVPEPSALFFLTTICFTAVVRRTRREMPRSRVGSV